MSRRQRNYKKLVQGDLEIMPLMNLFVVLIPMLLLSAVFLQLTVINMDEPDAAELPDDQERDDPLELAVRIEDDRYVIEGKPLDPTVIERIDRSDSSDGTGQVVGASLSGAPEGTDGKSGPADELTAALSAISERYPDNTAVRIVSQAHTLYEDIILVMDVSRTAGLPDVSLQAAN